MIFIRKHREKIISNAKVMYKQKVSNDTTAGYVNQRWIFKHLKSYVIGMRKQRRC